MKLTLRKQLPFILALTVTTFLLWTSLVYADSSGTADEASQFSKGIQTVLWAIVNNVFGLLVGIGGLVLNYAVEHFVVGFGDQFLTTGVGVAVDQLWVFVRDVFNLTFVFGLVWLGFRMILNSDDSNTRRWLISLIMAALLVNFSLFITKFVVDFSNILATEIVNATFDTSSGAPNISGTFMQIIGLPSIWDTSAWGEQERNTILNGGEGGYGYIFGALFVFIITAFVFFVGGIVLIIRYIALSLYMVLSPLMFLGWVFPQLQGITSQYWRGFLGRAFYAPVYLLLIAFSVRILENLRASMVGGAEFADALSGTGQAVNDNFESTFIPFILSAGFMLAAIVVGGKMSADGASTAIRVGNNLRGRAQRGLTRAAGAGTAGAAAAGLRNTAGRTAYNLTQNDKFKNYAARSYMGKQMYTAASGAANASFDARRVGGVGKSTGLGEGKKGGFKGSLDERKKRDDAYLKELGTVNIYNDDGTIKDEFKSKIDARVKENATVQAVRSQAEGKRAERDALATARDAQTAQVSTARTELDAIETKMKEEKQPINQRIEELNEKLTNADELEKDGIRKEIDDARKSLSDVDTRFAPQMDAATKQVAAAQATLTNAEKDVQRAEKELKQVEGVVKKVVESAEAVESARETNSRQIAFMQQTEASKKFWNKSATIFGGGAVGQQAGVAGAGLAGAGLASTAGIGAAGFIVGGATAGAQAQRAAYAQKEMAKNYGAYGKKMNPKDAQLLARVQRRIDAGETVSQDDLKKKDETLEKLAERLDGEEKSSSKDNEKDND